MTTAGETVVFITAPGEDEAAGIAKTLVEEKLAACVNIIRNVRSIYRWQGKIQDDAEVLLIVKTQNSRFRALCERVKELHSYEVPEVISLPITQGSQDYLKWLIESTGEQKSEGGL
jgi:periplasmic divalent cation tolerance protein